MDVPSPIAVIEPLSALFNRSYNKYILHVHGYKNNKEVTALALVEETSSRQIIK